MSYHMAKKCFEENKALVGPDPMTDPQTWNLNNGLANLTDAIHADLAEIQRLLAQIARAVSQ